MNELDEYADEIPTYPDGTIVDGPYFRKDQLKERIEFLLLFFKDEDKRLIKKVLKEIIGDSDE